MGKRYRVGRPNDTLFAYRSLRDDIAAGFSSIRRRRAEREAQRTFWALRSISFEVSRGERVGIIGRNGAGKSTLLKLLSRVTPPSEGRGEIRGRVGSLLEVGTGFHPELTGRDNVYLSAAILGMSRSEVRKKFDEIVAFAGIERFLDTPVKRYSSGMYLRLAFAVAAHLDPDILLVDEVLAVGDAEFQKKCLGRMEQLGESGRTLLFVSHSMPAILRLCDRIILLDAGTVVADGLPREVVRQYLDAGLGSSSERSWSDREAAPGDNVARLKAVRVRSSGLVSEEVDIEKPIEIEVEYWHCPGHALAPYVVLWFYDDKGVLLFVSADWNNHRWRMADRLPGVITSTCHIPANYLSEGRIFVRADLVTINPNVVHARESDVVSFQVVDRSQGGGARGDWAGEYPGVVRPLLDWEIAARPIEEAPIA